MTLRLVGNKHLGKDKEERALITALKKAESIAIRLVATKITPDVRSAVRKCSLPEEEVEEVVHDALMVLISAIQEGKYEDQDYHPAAYAMGVARKLIANRARAKKVDNVELDKLQLVSDFDPERYVNEKEQRSLVEKLLQQLGDTCQQLIRFKYFDNLKDKEIVAQQLLEFSTTDSVKSKRSQCMKKLVEIAQAAGVQTDILKSK